MLEVHLTTCHKHGMFQQTWQLVPQEESVCATCYVDVNDKWSNQLVAQQTKPYIH
jgi:hypothetical protein